MGPGKRALFKIASWTWGMHISPGLAFKALGYHGGMVLHRGWMQRINNSNPMVRDCFSRLIMQTCMRHTSMDRCLDVVIEFGGFARKPLSELFRQNPVLQALPITFMYGEKDFFKRDHADKLISDGVLKISKVFTIAAS